MPTFAQSATERLRHPRRRGRSTPRRTKKPETPWSDRNRAAAEAKRARRRQRNLRNR